MGGTNLVSETTNAEHQFEFEFDDEKQHYIVSTKTLDGKSARGSFQYDSRNALFYGHVWIEDDGPTVVPGASWFYDIEDFDDAEGNVEAAVALLKERLIQHVERYQRREISPRAAMYEYFHQYMPVTETTAR